MNNNPRGRIYQDEHFVFTEFNGLKVEKLIVCEDPDTNTTILVYLKVENNGWHQFFLDAGCGFWENWDEIETDDESYNFIDKTTEFDLYGKIITKIWCEPHEKNSQIIIVFSSREKLILRSIDPGQFDSRAELVKIAVI